MPRKPSQYRCLEKPYRLQSRKLPCSSPINSRGYKQRAYLLHAQLLPVARTETSVRPYVNRQRRQSHKVGQVCVLHTLHQYVRACDHGALRQSTLTHNVR